MSVANEENAVKMSDYDEGFRAGMQIVLSLANKRIEDLEAKLAKAVETISLCRKMQAQFAHTEDPLMVLLDTTIAELSSVSCANLKG